MSKAPMPTAVSHVRPPPRAARSHAKTLTRGGGPSVGFQRAERRFDPALQANSGSRQARILVADDQAASRHAIRRALASQGYGRVTLLEDISQTPSRAAAQPPDLIALQLCTYPVHGLDILASVRAVPNLRQLPIIVVSRRESRSQRAAALRLGADAYFTLPLQDTPFLPVVSRLLARQCQVQQLRRLVYRGEQQLRRTQEQMVQCLARALAFRDNDTGQHSQRVGEYAAVVAAQMGIRQQQSRLVGWAAMLHDIGKLGIPDTILRKPSSLAADEWTVMQHHTRIGGQICTPHSSDSDFLLAGPHTAWGGSQLAADSDDLLTLAGRIALTHHEHWDGSGYPHGLAGLEIPVEGRITAVADAFDAMSSDRPYQPRLPLKVCYSRLAEQSGRQFDPAVWRAFYAVRGRIEAIRARYAA